MHAAVQPWSAVRFQTQLTAVSLHACTYSRALQIMHDVVNLHMECHAASQVHLLQVQNWSQVKCCKTTSGCMVCEVSSKGDHSLDLQHN